VAADGPFKRRLSQVQVAVQNQDNREHDIFDSDDYFQFHGGMIAAIRSLTGENPAAYFGDTSVPDRVRVRDLADEARRVFRSRVVNPKWVASVMRHGYKGAFEMAATVDYLFGYEATARVIDDWMFEDLARSYLLDPQVQEFLQEKNPWALRSMAERLLEAVERQLWENPKAETVEALNELYLRNESVLESR
jgi:cobaltochelatase CobN